jgi:hypothetical protein
MNLVTKFMRLGTMGLAALSMIACTQTSQLTPVANTQVAETPVTIENNTETNTEPVTTTAVAGNTADTTQTTSSLSEIVVYAADLPEDALYELEPWEDPASPGGLLLGVTNNGDELDPPPENDPHATFTVQVQAGVPYRCWIHMKVGASKGASTANVMWVQLSHAVDKANQPVFQPESASFLTAQGLAQEGWSWVECALEEAETDEPVVTFNTSGEITVLVQAGMEGVGFDQFLLSSAQFLEQPPTEAIIQK